MEDMQTWTTDELVEVWAGSEVQAERYAASIIVRQRMTDSLHLKRVLLPKYGQEHPEKMRHI